MRKSKNNGVVVRSFVDDRSALLYDRALNARRNPTREERRLWGALHIAGVDHWIKRQRVFGPYYVDLYVPARRAAIEIDGAHHLGGGQREYDVRRTAYLLGIGVDVLRYSNAAVRADAHAVVCDIVNRLHIEPDRPVDEGARNPRHRRRPVTAGASAATAWLDQ